jgi:hypothetical protein
MLTMLCACLVAELGKLHFLRHIDDSNNQCLDANRKGMDQGWHDPLCDE